MPKVTLTFDCPEENTELRQAIDGGRWEGVVWDLDQWLRQMVKYGGDDEKEAEFAEIVRTEIADLMSGLEFSP